MGSENHHQMKSIGTSLLLLLLIPIFTLLFIYISIFNSSSNPFQITSNIVPRKNRHLLLLPRSSETTSITHQQKQLLQLAHFHCSETLYKDLCITTLSSFPNLHNQPLNNVICASLNLTVHEVESSASNCSYTLGNMTISTSTIQQKRALQDCIELLDDTIDELQSAVVDLESKKIKYADVQTLLSAAMTNQYTCLDGVGTANKTLRDTILQPKLTKISQHVSNALAMLKKTKLPKPNSSVFGENDVDGFPGWMSKKDRRLLETPLEEMKYDVVVAKDGSGNFTTVAEAVAAAPVKSETRFVIYIKKGAYLENVEVKKKMRMIMFVGDGIEKTVIKGYRNVVDGWTTFRSATLAVVGAGFIAKGLSVENASGPNKHQAVALRSGSDLSAFYKCSFVGYQDTLYVHSLRQFYRECDVYGTVDFIFGNAAVVFQNSNLYARKPNENQKNIFTAQGRDDPNQNTGISIQNCKLTAAADLLGNKTAFPTYLGRPWRLYSRTVVMESYIDDVVKPAGWLEWSGDFALNTSYYGEYKNTGPGANTSGRVSWVGVHPTMNSTEAEQFTVGRFIEGSDWIPGYHIPASYQLTVA